MNFFGIAAAVLFVMSVASSWYTGRQERQGYSVNLFWWLIFAEWACGEIFFLTWVWGVTSGWVLMVILCGVLYLVTSVLAMISVNDPKLQ